jgi:hypothetical protein
MNFDYSEAEEYEADFAACGEIEFDETDEADAAIEMELLELVEFSQRLRSYG